ncbi:MAG: hypothetical protein ABJA02_00280 [Acidobacteriota bacterium]
MALGIIRLASVSARAVASACFVFALIVTLLFAKWCFANALSTHTAERDAAELALALGPDDPQTHYAVAVIDEKTFDPADQELSIAEFEKAAALSPYNFLSWLALAHARDRQGDVAGADRAYSRAAELAPNYSEVKWAYGNFMVRTGREEQGFSLISQAAASSPTLMPNAVTTALSFFDGDVVKVRDLLGNTGLVNICVAKNAAGKKDFVSAYSSWSLISVDERRLDFHDDGIALSDQLAQARQFRMAAMVVNDVASDTAEHVRVGEITNGSFEKLDQTNKNIFDWQIGSGAGQQIGLNTERRTEGEFSLYMVFNTMRADEFRSISQTVAVEPGSTYTLSGSYRSELKGGVAWEVADAADSKMLAKTSISGTSQDWARFEVHFSVPAASDGILLRLVRDGCSSAVCPISGKLWFDGLTLTRQN